MTDRPDIATGAVADSTSRRMLRPSHLWTAILVLSAWLISGFYIVRGNEQAVVRRFGALVRNAGGGVEIYSSGLRWDLPWPLARIDRVNTREVRTLTMAGPNLDQNSTRTPRLNSSPTSTRHTSPSSSPAIETSSICKSPFTTMWVTSIGSCSVNPTRVPG